MTLPTPRVPTPYIPDTPLMFALETSGAPCSVAIARGETLLAELSLFEPFLHDERLAESCRFLCRALGIKVAELGIIAVSAGPGSFAGLRIGAAFAKALCFRETPDTPAPALVAVPTLEAYASDAARALEALGALDDFRSICVCAHSHKNLAYRQDFTAQGEAQTEVVLVEHASVAPNADTFFCGTLFDGRAEFGSRFDSRYRSLPALAKPAASRVASCAWELYLRGDVADAEAFVPLYGQEFTVKTR